MNGKLGRHWILRAITWGSLLPLTHSCPQNQRDREHFNVNKPLDLISSFKPFSIKVVYFVYVRVWVLVLDVRMLLHVCWGQGGNFWESVLSFHHGSLRDQTQIP